MRRIIILFWCAFILGIQGYTQEIKNGYFVNPNAHKAKLYLVAQNVEKGLLYKIDSDSVFLANYKERRSKKSLEIIEINAFPIQSIRMVKTLDRNSIPRGAKKGGIIGGIAGGLFSGFIFATWGEGNLEYFDSVLLFTAGVMGVGAAIGAAIGSNSVEFQVDYSWTKFQEMKVALDRRAYLTKSQRPIK
jgi:outer membrane lipoprotein SlyB